MSDALRISSTELATTSSGGDAPRRDDASGLREFCDLVLRLGPESEGKSSILESILPSLMAGLARCWASHESVREEFRIWVRQARRLAELSRLHHGADGECMASRLDEFETSAERAIVTIESLASRPLEEEEFRDRAEDGQKLRALCAAILSLLDSNADGRALLSRTLPSILRVFERVTPDSISRLRQDLRDSLAETERLMELARLHSGEESTGLARRMFHAHALAARWIDALESLQMGADAGAELRVFGGAAKPTGIEANSDLALFELADRLQRQRQFHRAESLYSELLAHHPDYPRATLRRGQARLALGKATLALADLRNAVLANPADAVSWQWRGNALALAKRFAEAIADYDMALTLSPDLPTVRYNRAVALREVGRLGEARSEFEAMLPSRTQRAPIHLNLGLIHLADGRREMAIREFRMATQCEPRSREAIDRLAELGASPSEDSFEEIVAPARATETRLVQSRSPIAEASPASTRDPSASSMFAPRSDALPASPDSDVAFFAEIALADPPLLPPQEKEPPAKSISPAKVLERRSDAGVSRPEVVPAGLRRPNESADRGHRAEIEPSCNLNLVCPSCGAPCGIRWDRLRPGRILTCPQCKRNCTVRPYGDGELTPLSKDRDGHWTVKGSRTVGRLKTFARWGAIGVMSIALAFAVQSAFRGSSPAEVQTPVELEPRARLFGEAWLRKDYQVIRRLTDPGQGPLLFAWHRAHPAPEIDDSVVIEVRMIEESPTAVKLSLSFVGSPEGGETPLELNLHWREENGEWFFVPDAARRPDSPRKRPALADSRTRTAAARYPDLCSCLDFSFSQRS